MKHFIMILPFTILIGCATTGTERPATPPLPAPSADSCGANNYAGLIGQDATALERVLIMGQVRVIRPGQAVSMDFRENRINFVIDGQNRITTIGCY